MTYRWQTSNKQSSRVWTLGSPKNPTKNRSFLGWFFEGIQVWNCNHLNGFQPYNPSNATVTVSELHRHWREEAPSEAGKVQKVLLNRFKLNGWKVESGIVEGIDSAPFDDFPTYALSFQNILGSNWIENGLGFPTHDFSENWWCNRGSFFSWVWGKVRQLKPFQLLFGTSAVESSLGPQQKPKITDGSIGSLQNVKVVFLCTYGCFLKWWYPQNTPKWSFLVGKPMVVGYHHFRKPPYSATSMGMLHISRMKNKTRGASRRRFCGLRSNGGILGLVKSRLFAHQAGKTTTLNHQKLGLVPTPQWGRQNPKHCRRLKTVLSTMYIYAHILQILFQLKFPILDFSSCFSIFSAFFPASRCTRFSFQTPENLNLENVPYWSNPQDSNQKRTAPGPETFQWYENPEKTLGFPGPETLALRSENLPSFLEETVGPADFPTSKVWREGTGGWTRSPFHLGAGA